MGILLKAVAIVLFTSSSFAQATTFFGDHARGWHWYEELPIPEEPEKEEEKGEAKAPQTPSEKIKAYREDLENSLAQAWLEPTHQNIQIYQEKQKHMLDRSQVFSEKWMQNVYTNANLDHTLVAPVNQKAVHVYLDEQKRQKKEIIQTLSKSYGLFFFYSSDCPYCHQFAPIVKMFSEMYGWEVLAISLDGGKIEAFPGAVPDNGLARTWNVTALPSLFAVSPETEEAIPVAQGMTSIDEMEKRILSIVRKQP